MEKQLTLKCPLILYIDVIKIIKNMKTITKDDVKNVAVEFLQNEMLVTNLDIKNDLRTRGFFVTQQAVAKNMNELHLEGLFGFSFNGIYRSYFLMNVDSNLSISTNTVKKISKLTKGSKTSIQIDTTNGICQYTNRAGKTIVGYTTELNHKFKVFSSNSLVADILYFDHGYSRDEMRYAFKKLSHEKSYNNIRVNLI